jgi:3-oxoacid CoA-transferase
MRAVDHAVEFQYNPVAAEFPTKRLCLEALRDLFALLPICHTTPDDADIRQKLLIAAYSAMFSLSFSTGLGLSHSIGHAIGATYAIPHGITSCISLAPTVRFKAESKPDEARQITRILPYIGKESSGNATADSHAVADAIDDLVASLGLRSTLTDVSSFSEYVLRAFHKFLTPNSTM